jgi:hypothetical protein
MVVARSLTSSYTSLTEDLRWRIMKRMFGPKRSRENCVVGNSSHSVIWVITWLRVDRLNTLNEYMK